jgi:chromosome segregation ATPase
MSSSDTRLVDFAQARINRIAEAIDNFAEQLKMTNTHVERLNREVGELRGEVGGLRGEVGSLRSEMNARFDRVDHQVRDVHGEVILQANQIINAQQQAMRAMMRLDDIEQRPIEPKP